jgi:acyl-CoA reductase-like NAD-dependent aldehyde dehydrogenase
LTLSLAFVRLKSAAIYTAELDFLAERANSTAKGFSHEALSRSSEDLMATAVRPTVFRNFINGEWVESASGTAFEDRNPANTGELIGLFPRSTAEDVDAAVRAAADAFESWRLVPAPKRAEILYRAAETLVKHKDDMARDMTREMGKVLAETRGDVQEAIDMTYYMAGEGRRLFGQTTPSELPSKFAMSARQPLGVCAMITPWNFPMAIPSWKIMPALVCGNTVVIKPAEDTPLSTYNLIQVLTESGVPRGVVNVVNGTGPDAGAPLVDHPDVAAVSFTGSSEVGRLVSEACAPRLRPCHLEMGGKNILIVLEDANLDLAVEGAVWGGFGTTGQRCTAASRVAVHTKVYKEFLHRFTERVKALRVGDGLDPATDMGPCINEEQLGKVMEYVAIGKTEGAKLVAGGHRLTDGPCANGWFHEATIFADCDPRMRIAQEEIFGPVVAVMPIEGFEKAIEVANGVPYGLSASIYTLDVNRAFQAMRDLHTGIVYVNAPTIGAEIHLPFGGTKRTGNGHREAGTAALDFYSEWKTLYIDYSNRLQRAQIDS